MSITATTSFIATIPATWRKARRMHLCRRPLCVRAETILGARPGGPEAPS